RTEVRLLMDPENLYIGIRCFDPEPAKVSLHSMQRDIEDPFGDDFVTLVFDTFGDRRTAYWFEVHATGSVSDGLIPGPGIFTTDWDGVWEARTSFDAAGWTVEMRIPSRTLHFKTGLSDWGFNVLRYVARDRIIFHWSGVTIDSDVLDLSSAGLLSGVAGLDQGNGLTLAPYTLGRFERSPDDGTESTIGRGGLDLTFSPTPGLTGILTANTDFAETEVDTRQINLTRFDLFFPEKRPFFLEGSSLFTFGLGLEQDFVPFYSRRVGLVERPAEFETVPIGCWAARSGGYLLRCNREVWGFKVYLPNDFWEAYVRFMQFGDALDPALGFLPRPGTRWYDFWNALKPRPGPAGAFRWIRQAFFETGYKQVDDLDGRPESRRLFTAPVNIETESGEHF